MLLTVSLPGCLPYKPTLKLHHSPATIPARVFLEPLRDLTPPEDRDPASSQGLSQTSAGSMEGDLAPLVTRALLADFSATGVFHSFSTERSRADWILTGTIHRFHGEVSLPAWLLIPGLDLAVQALWGAVQEWEGVVELELTLSSPDGGQLGTYRGTARYDEVAHYDHHYWAMPLYPAHARLNRAFTDAVEQIRDQIFHDRERLLASLRREASSPEPLHTAK